VRPRTPPSACDAPASCIQSAFWHRFTATAHSPIGCSPDLYGITIRRTPSTFARNALAFEDPTGTDHDFFAEGLRRAIYNYMHGLGLDDDVRSWFGRGRKRSVPATTVPRDLIARAPR